MNILQAKLVKMFSKQLVTKAKLKTDPPLADLEQYPDTEQWLKIVAISDQPVKVSFLTPRTLMSTTVDILCFD